MSKKIYRVQGQVIHQQNRNALRGVRVEIWDKDKKYHDLLGERLTDNEGRFERVFDETYFGDCTPDRMPDLFFKVYQGEQLLKSTEDSVLWDVREGDIPVTIEIDMPVEKQVGPDRVTAEQVTHWVDCFRRSDFKGVSQEVSNRFKTAGSLIGKMVKASVSKAVCEPIVPPTYRVTHVISEDTQAAQVNLKNHGVIVTAIEPYQPEFNRSSLQTIAALPVNLKAGDKVILYAQEERVKAYSIVKEKGADDIKANPLKQDLNRVEDRVMDTATIKAEILSLKQDIAQKDSVIVALKQELVSLQSAHNELAAKVQPTVIDTMQKQLQKLLEQQNKRPPISSPKREKPNT